MLNFPNIYRIYAARNLMEQSSVKLQKTIQTIIIYKWRTAVAYSICKSWHHMGDKNLKQIIKEKVVKRCEIVFKEIKKKNYIYIYNTIHLRQKLLKCYAQNMIFELKLKI